jgi:predicted  nucleic acid-binding Zn-ribbon protein
MAGFGGSVKLTGESEYRKALKSISDNLTVVASEMKVVNSLYDKNDSSTAKLSAQNDILSKRLDEQNKKLAEAKKMLDQAKNSTDSNAQTVAKWQNEVNKAQAEVNQTTREIKDNTAQIKKNEDALDDAGKELKDFKDGEDKAGQSAVKMGDLIKANIISDAIIGGIKALGSAMVGIAKQTVELGKQAIESFAEYEQLIGGVETLFKESSGVVENYANNAYKTAGLSANEYMSTVTSFTASLLQSLNGDTAKSAEVADMAITDMSDNANKMGTSMESIQNAYQGFAKQNYTMLDNLKLGYGGTKSEMERLLQDATAISGVEYDISNLNDVYQAIHIIQGELGITGTTAKEASTTIQGSLSSMKSAWQNLLTGMADENADFGGLITNFVDSILTVGDNLLPRITTVIQGMGELVSGLLTTLVPEIITAIPPLIESTLPILLTAIQTAITSILSVLPQITQSISDLLPQILTAFVGMLPLILDAGITIILSLVQGIVSSIPTLIPAIVQAVITIVENLIGNIDMIIDAGIQLLIGLMDGLIDAIPILVQAIPVIIEKLLTAIINNLPKIIKAGFELLGKFQQGIYNAIPQLIQAIPQIIVSIVTALVQGIPQLISAGGELLAGLFKGLLNPQAIWNAVKGLFNGVVGGIKTLFGIHSPSTVFENEIGKNLALGIGSGFEDTMAGVTDQMASAIPTDFDISANANIGASTSNINSFANMVEAFKQALREVNIVLDDEVAGRFVTDTVERVVYA